MRTLTVLVAGFISGCIQSDGDGTDVGSPRACTGTTTLEGMSAPGSATIDMQTYDAAGAFICVELDARAYTEEATFNAGTAYEQAAASSFDLSLRQGDTELSVGQDHRLNDNVYAGLEYHVPAGDLVAVELLVRARSDAAITQVRLLLEGSSE